MNEKWIKQTVERMLSISNGIYLIAALLLSLFSLFLLISAGVDVYQALIDPQQDVSLQLLDAIGLVVISIAIFDVGKYIVEEEVSRDKQLRSPHEARKTLTKFIVIIFIAISLESLVYTFIASKEDIRLLIYPGILLFSSVLLIVGLGIYQKLSIQVEKDIHYYKNDSPKLKIQE